MLLERQRLKKLLRDVDPFVAADDPLHLVVTDFLLRLEDVSVVVYEDFLCVGWDCRVVKTVVDAPVVVNVQNVDNGLSRKVTEADVVKYNTIMFVGVEVLQVFNMAHHQRVGEMAQCKLCLPSPSCSVNEPARGPIVDHWNFRLNKIRFARFLGVLCRPVVLEKTDLRRDHMCVGTECIHLLACLALLHIFACFSQLFCFVLAHRDLTIDLRVFLVTVLDLVPPVLNALRWINVAVTTLKVEEIWVLDVK